MIYMFRNEMKKWHAVLWVVFASLAIGSGFGLFYKRKSPDEAVIGSVDGQSISFKYFRRTLKQILAPYEQLYGMSEDKIMGLLSKMGNLEELAFNLCVQERLLDRVQQNFNISIDTESFNNQLAAVIPPTVIDENGKVNMEIYQQYLRLLATTPAEFEKAKEDEFKRELVMKFIANSSYTPASLIKAEYNQNNAMKNFEILVLPQKHFVDEAKKAGIDEKALESFFTKNKENYRVSDKAIAKYWEIDVDKYEKKIEVDEVAIKAFYDKNKAQLYRIPPKVKVRKILVKDMKLAQDLHQKVKQNPSQFALLAKENSIDKESSKDGGLVDFFSRGKYDADFEKAAFKLKESGNISDIIKTKDGLAIIQLVERIKAEEKTLESVKNEIVGTLKNKRAIAALQGELGTLMHDARADAELIERFAKDNGLTEHQTGWLSEAESMNADINGQIAQKLLSSGRECNFGNFRSSGKFVLYKLVKKEKSYLPELRQVRDAVVTDYYQSQSELLVKKTVAKIKTDVLNGKATLKDSAAKLGFELITTGFSKKGDKVAGLESNLPLLKKMFILNDKSQVLQYDHAGIYYLVQLISEQAVVADKFAASLNEYMAKEKFGNARKQVSSFIASLQSNSKVDMNKDILDGYKNKYTKED